jgi:hypothetical protein
MASIRKRTTRRGDVRYDVRYRTIDGEQREETFRTRREADHRLHAVEADKVRGGWLDPRRASRPFGEISEEWFASNLPSVLAPVRVTGRFSTATSYRRCVIIHSVQ